MHRVGKAGGCGLNLFLRALMMVTVSHILNFLSRIMLLSASLGACMSHNVLNTVEQKSLSRRHCTFNQQLARHNRCSKVAEPPVKCYCGRPAGLGGADQGLKYWILPPDSTSSKLQQGWPVCGSGSWIGYAGVTPTRIACLSRVWSCTWLNSRLFTAVFSSRKRWSCH